MPIYRNTFDDYMQTRSAIAEFPYCGGCPSPVKIQQIGGQWFLLCQEFPIRHYGNGIKRSAYTSQMTPPSKGFRIWFRQWDGSYAPSNHWAPTKQGATYLIQRLGGSERVVATQKDPNKGQGTVA